MFLCQIEKGITDLALQTKADSEPAHALPTTPLRARLYQSGPCSGQLAEFPLSQQASYLPCSPCSFLMASLEL